MPYLCKELTLKKVESEEGKNDGYLTYQTKCQGLQVPCFTSTLQLVEDIPSAGGSAATIEGFPKSFSPMQAHLAFGACAGGALPQRPHARVARCVHTRVGCWGWWGVGANRRPPTTSSTSCRGATSTPTTSHQAHPFLPTPRSAPRGQRAGCLLYCMQRGGGDVA